MRHLRESQELWENYLTCAARLAKPADVVYAFHRLLDLRAQAKLGAGAKGAWAPDAAVLEALVREAVAMRERVEEEEGEGEGVRVAQASLLKQVCARTNEACMTHE